MIFIINIPTCMCDDYTDCNEAFDCGDSVTNLKYPFWGKSRKECGFSDQNMELTCERNVPKITINNVKYRILEWYNTTQILKVARDDYFNGICSVSVSANHNNSTFDKTQFQRDGDGSYKISLLYNCETSIMNIFGTTCSSTKVSYTIVDPATVSLTCTPSVIVEFPILAGQPAQIASLDVLNEAIQGGFDLRWTGNYAECQMCVDSRGACGNDGGTGFRCFCEDGAYPDRCGSRKAPTSSMSFTFLYN